MGRAYFYCVQCSGRVSDADLDTGKAFRVGDHILCLDCTPESSRVQTSKRIPAAPRPKNPPPPVPAATPAAPPNRKKLILVALIVILAVALIRAFQDTSPTVPPKDSTIGTPAPPVPPSPPPPNPPRPVDSKEASSKADLDKARAFAKAHPEDLAGQQREFGEVVWKWGDTAAAKEAGREAAAVKTAVLEKVGAWTAEMEAQIKGLVDAKQYVAAEKKVQELKAARDLPEWKLAAEKRASELHVLGMRHAEAEAGRNPPPVTPKVVSEGAKAYQARFEAAAARAATRDFTAAIAELEGAAAAIKDADLKAEMDDDAALMKKASAVMKESLDWLRRRQRGVGLWVSYRDGTGGVKQASGPVLLIDAERVEIRSGKGTLFIEWADVTASTMAEVAQKAAFEPRTLAALCALEGETEAAKAFAAELPAKWWTWAEGARAKLPKPDPAEKSARDLYVSAETAFRSMATRGAGVEQYRTLRTEHGSTALVKVYTERIVRRSESGREYYFAPPDFGTQGTIGKGKNGKLESARDTDVVETLQNGAEIEFAVLPGQTYRCWLQVGACCEETFAFYLQGTEVTDYDSKKKQRISCEPGTTFAVTVKHGIRNLKKTHDDHRPKGVKVFPKTAARWEWVEIVLPKYAAPGAKKLRVCTNQAGFSVGGAVVSVSRKTAPAEAEVKDLEKARPYEDPQVPGDLTDLVAWWSFDEDSGEVVDLSGKGHTAKRSGGASTVPGKIGAALHTDGGKSGAEAADAEDLRITGDLTLAIWVRKTVDVGEWSCVLGKGTYDQRNYGIWLEPSSNRWMYQQYGEHIDLIAGKLVEVGPWNHLAVTIEKDLVKVYTNGVLDGQKPRPGMPAASGGPVGIGYAMNHKGFIGDLDDARIYRRALSADEIRALVDLGK